MRFATFDLLGSFIEIGGLKLMGNFRRHKVVADWILKVQFVVLMAGSVEGN